MDDKYNINNTNSNVKSLLEEEDNIDQVKEKIRCQRCTGDIMLGITFLGRVILTLYSFHGLFFVYNIIFQYIILFAGVLYDIKGVFFQIIMALIYILFSLSAGNILVIPTYEFLTLPFLNYKNPFVHLQSFVYIIKNIKFDTEKMIRKNSTIINVFLIILESFYLIGFLYVYFITAKTKIKDYCKVVILFLIYIYYLLIILCYCIMLIFLMIKLLITSFREYNKEEKEKKEKNKKYKVNFFIKYWSILINSVRNLEPFFSKKEELPDINLLSYIINPYLKKSYQFKGSILAEKKYLSDYCDLIGIYQKILLLITTIVVFIIIACNSSGAGFFTIISFIFLFIVLSTLSIGINFPFCFRNKRTFGSFFASTDYKYIVKVRHPIMVPLIRFIFNALIVLVCFGLLFIFFFTSDKESTATDLQELNLNGTILNDLTGHTKGKLLPIMCYSSLYYFPLHTFLPFINDAYYYNNGKSSLDVKEYRDLFFNDNYKIDVYDDLIEKIENIKDKDLGNVKMIQYNIKGEKTELTILSIKGTTYKKDIFLDIQLYFPSVLLSILSTFSLSQKDNLSNKLIEYSLSIPYRMFFQFLIVDKYIELLKKAYIENRKNFLKNVIIVGHSLGGGLAKILGRFLKMQAISLSGPGMNAFNSLWKYEGDSEFFGISAIDLVPDMDLVPRVEVSGGTIYRIICISGVFNCHGKERSLCEVLIMCRHPNYMEYCAKVAELSQDEIETLYKNSELNTN